MNKISVDKIIDHYTISWNELKKWYWQLVVPQSTGVEDIDKAVKDTSINVETVLRNLLYFTIPRFLYEFFDENDIKIFISPEINGHWDYNIRSSDRQHENGQGFLSRVLAEEQAFMAAFQILNTKLKKNSLPGI